MAVYTRQSTFTDGDTIFAALLNNEYDQLAAAFNVSSGHTHDGSTAGDGGPISKLFSNAITFGTNVNADVVLTFDATSNDGVLSWMEDEDYFQFSDDILLSTDEKILFRDSAISINSSINKRNSLFMFFPDPMEIFEPNYNSYNGPIIVQVHFLGFSCN